ncbi:MAG: hypothetical protein RIQ38_2604 [Pseudomonadota bacterium]|jgi:ADP-ribose pyrophosphatase
MSAARSGPPADPADLAHLREHPLTREPVLRGHFLQVVREMVRLPDGTEASREFIVHPGAAVIVPMLTLPDGRDAVIMERQWRHPVGQAVLEFPAGKLDPGEPHGQAAMRELREETGYLAREWAYVGGMHPTVAYSTEVIHMWLARDLQSGPRSLDAGEFLDVLTVPVDELLDLCRQGQISDAKTLMGALWLQNIREGRWQPTWQAGHPIAP